MKSRSRLRVLSDRIPRVLVFVYFCRGLSGNTEERPTHRDYIEILTCRAIILHLEDSRSHETEAEAKLGQAQGARPGSLGARPSAGAKSWLFRSGYSTDLLDQENIVPPRLSTQKRIEGEDYIRRPPLALEETRNYHRDWGVPSKENLFSK